MKRYPPPGALIDVGGHRLQLHCMGQGSPTVILDAGGGPHGSLSWRPVHAELARDTRVCAYDRAGTLWSERGPAPRSGERAVAELAALLQAAEISGPVVLVGHSLGGQFAVQFAHRYPERIAGLVRWWMRLPPPCSTACPRRSAQPSFRPAPCGLWGVSRPRSGSCVSRGTALRRPTS